MNPQRLRNSEERKPHLIFFLCLTAILFAFGTVLGPDGALRNRNKIGSFSRLGKSEASKRHPAMQKYSKKNEFERLKEYFGKFEVRAGKKMNNDEAEVESSELGGQKTISAFGRYWDKQVPMDNVVRRNREGAKRLSAVIDPPAASSHASSLLALPNGDVLLAFFSGEGEGGDGVGIAVSKLKHGETKWSEAKFVSKMKGRSNQNPVLFRNNAKNDENDSNHVRIVHASEVSFQGQGTSDMRSLYSTDGGETWSKPEIVDHQNGAFPKNSVIRALNGDLLLPMYYTPSGFFDHATQYSMLQKSSDLGKSWKPLVEFPGTRGNLVQPTVVRLNNNDLLSFFRSRTADFIWASRSTDDGKTWSDPKPTKFPNNNAGIQMIKLRNTKQDILVLVFNNCNEGRYPLSIALSEDGGKSFKQIRDLEPDVDFDHESENREKSNFGGSDGEYSYPSIQEDAKHDGLIHVAYTFRRETIKYSAFMLDWLKEESEEAKTSGKVTEIDDTFNDAEYMDSLAYKRNDWEFDRNSDNDKNPANPYILH